MSVTDTEMQARSPAGALAALFAPAGGRYYPEQVELLYGYLPLSQAVTLILAAGLVMAMHASLPPGPLYGWAAVLTLLSLGRLALGRLYRRRRAAVGPERWALWFAAGSMASACAWGAVPLLLFPEGDLVHQTLIAFLIGGLVIGGVVTLASVRAVAVGFILAALLPLVLRLALVGDGEHYFMAGMIAVFAGAMVGGARMVNAIVLTSLHLRDENAAQSLVLDRQARELEQRALRLQAILDNTVDSIITVDGNGYIQAFNRAAERTFGYTAEQVVGRPLAVLLPPQAAEVWTRRWGQCLGVSRERNAVCELTLMRQDGSMFPVELSLREVAHGERRLYVGIFRDVTERKRMERLKNEFISTVSHELRTPLTSIRGALGLIAGGKAGELPEQTRALVEIAAKNSERLSRLIQDILDVERLEAGVMKFDLRPQPLMPVIEQAVQANAAYAEVYGTRLQVTETLPGARVVMDADRIGQVLANLISNAIKFSPRGQAVELLVSRRGDAVRTAVRDRGPGIPIEFRPRVFQKFAQADASNERSGNGTGLGLSISKAIVERHGGEIGFDTKLDGGTTFWFDLPAAPEPSA